MIIGNRNFRAGPQTSLEGFICPQNSDKQQKIKVFGRSGGGASYLTRKSKTLLWPFILFRVLLVGYWYVVESKFRELDLGPIWFLLVLYLVEVITFPIVSQFRL